MVMDAPRALDRVGKCPRARERRSRATQVAMYVARSQVIAASPVKVPLH